MEKHKGYTNKIHLGPDSGEDTVFVKAVENAFNPNVLDDTGTPVSTPHNMHVDNNSIADIKPRMFQTMSSSIKALFVLIGQPQPHFKRPAVCMENF